MNYASQAISSNTKYIFSKQIAYYLGNKAFA